MARRNTNISNFASDVPRASLWTPEAPGFLDKRDQRESARQERRFAAIEPSYTQTRVATRRAYARESAQVNNRYSSVMVPLVEAEPYVQPAVIDDDQLRIRRGSAAAKLAHKRVWSPDDYREARGSGHIIDFEDARQAALRQESTRPANNGMDFAPFQDEAYEDDYAGKRSFGEKLAGLRHQMRHRKAERSFERNFEDAPRQAADEQAPRAAVYEGRMGRTHQKTARMQAPRGKGAGASPRAAGASLLERVMFRPHFARAAFAMLCLVFATVLVFPAAQDCYLQMRVKDQAVAEYEAIAARNAEIAGRVAALQTDEGMENLIHENLGWVREGENAVSVSYAGRSGVDPAVADQTASILPGSIPAPTTWYSPLLDFVFGYEDDASAKAAQSTPAAQDAAPADAGDAASEAEPTQDAAAAEAAPNAQGSEPAPASEPAQTA